MDVLKKENNIKPDVDVDSDNDTDVKLSAKSDSDPDIDDTKLDVELDLDIFNRYRKLYKKLPVQLLEFTNKVKAMQMKNKKSWKRINSNWIIKHKYNQDADDKLISNFKCILNKIGENNFDDISKELLKLDIDNCEHLNNLVELIFKKAVREDKYYDIYVKLSNLLFNKYVVDENNKKVYFRVLLLTKCQETFIQSINTESEDELVKAGLKYKLDLIGLVKFISGLYNYSLVTNSIIYDCLLTITVKVKEQKWFAVDCLCTIINCVNDNFKKNCPEKYEEIITFLEYLVKDKKIKSKDRFAIMDVLGI